MTSSGAQNETRVLRREAPAPRAIGADLCVLGAGIAGVSAALEAARLGARTVLVDGGMILGGQSVAAQIGTFCGLFANGRNPPPVTHGIADDILRDLGAQGDLHYRRSRRNTVVVQYRIDALARWIETAVQRAGIAVLLGAMLRGVKRAGNRVSALELVTRYGEVEVSAGGFVDATGDAALAWTAGLPVREAVGLAVQGTQMVVLEQVEEAALAGLDRLDLARRLAENGGQHGLLRQDGFAFVFPGSGEALINMTHLETPLDPLGASAMVLEGHALADRLVALLREEFPAAFGRAQIRSYGLPGVRQTRMIVGDYQLAVEDVRGGRDFPDAIARCSWPIELHDRPEGVHWEEFGDDHMHYVPLRSLTPPETDNLLAIGRCIDADPLALSSVRVMGPCIAMGAAAAHALDLAGAGSVHQLDIAALRRRLAGNLGL
jgi:glycine/D-amino acid oxidase-like deaminating enzyme